MTVCSLEVALDLHLSNASHAIDLANDSVDGLVDEGVLGLAVPEVLGDHGSDVY